VKPLRRASDGRNKVVETLALQNNVQHALLVAVDGPRDPRDVADLQRTSDDRYTLAAQTIGDGFAVVLALLAVV